MVDDGHQHATGASISRNNSSNSSQQDNSTQLLDGSSTIINSTSSSSQVAPSSNPSPSTASRVDLNNLTTTTTTTTTPTSQPIRERFAGMFPASKQTIMQPPLISKEKFHWDQTEQGHILGAFFLGYILFQIPGARMAELVGARWILMVSTAGSALISLIFPLSTQLDSIHLLMVLRFVMGLCQSAFFPAAYVFFCRWLTESERSVLLPIMFIGSNMGSISSYIMSSYLISSSYGWPSVFYVSGMICFFVTLLWCVFGSNGPQDNWLITKEERDYILNNMNGSNNTLQQVSVSTKNMDRNRPEAHSLIQSDNVVRMHRLIEHEPLNNFKSLAPARTSINKSKSANDLNPNWPLEARTSFHPEVIQLEMSAQHLKPTTTTRSQGLIGGKRADGPSHREDAFVGVGDQDQLSKTSSTQEAGRSLSWRKLLSSVPVWTLIFSMYGNEWSQVVLTYELPTYLNKALNIPIAQNGVINSFFQLSYTVASPILSSLGVYMLDKHLLGMRKIHIRKLFQSLATFGQLACFVSVPICGANRGLIIMFMFSAIVFKACANAGDIMVPGDLSPEFAGTIFALANSIGNTAGFFVPILAGVIVGEQYRREEWTPFWLTSAFIMGCSGVIFLIFGETRRQNYSEDDDDDDDDEDDDKEEDDANY